jgi:hypothetical protein
MSTVPTRARHRRQRGTSLALLITGSLLLLLGLGLLSGGGVLLWADRSQRGADGYISSQTERLQSDGYALVARDFSVDVPAWMTGVDRLGNVRATVTAASGKDVFVGIAERDTLDAYLRGVAHEDVTSWHGTTAATYVHYTGAAPPAPPGQQTFWVAKASGPGTQAVTWTVSGGTWAVVAMNADASSGVVVDAAGAATAPFLLRLAIGVLAAGFLIAAVALLLIVLGARPRRDQPAVQQWAAVPPPPGYAPPAGGAVAPLRMTVYPVALEGHLDEPLSRGLWLVKWFLLIPHYFVLAFLGMVALLLTVVAWFSILFTARYPRAIFDFNLGVLRWWWRVQFYGYSALATDRYPPFSLGDEPDYPARLDVAYPQRLSRGLVLVKSWLLAIPQLIVVCVLGGGSTLGGLIGLLAIIAGVLVLATRRYPRDVFPLLMGFNRWVFRVLAYVMLMRDEYPPFRLDSGEAEPEPFATVAPMPPQMPPAPAPS